MSVLFMDNFQSYGTDESKMTAGLPWAAVYTGGGGGLVTDPDGVSTGRVLKCTTSALGTSSSRISLPTAGDNIGVAFRWYITPLAASLSNSPSVLFSTAGRSEQYTLAATSTGSLRLYRQTGGTSTLLGESSPLVITSAAWTHIEVWVNSTTGVYEVRVEGVNVLSGTDGAPTTNNFGIIEFWDGLSIDGGAPGSTESDVYIKDLVLLDDAGSVNNTFIGTVQVIALRPNGDVSSGWTPSTGSSDSDILDDPSASDAANISAADTLPAASIVTLENLPEDVVSVKALQTMVRAVKTDGGDANLVVSLLSNGSEDAGATHAVLTSISTEWDISELDPDTAAQWTPTAVDASTLQIDRTL